MDEQNYSAVIESIISSKALASGEKIIKQIIEYRRLMHELKMTRIEMTKSAQLTQANTEIYQFENSALNVIIAEAQKSKNDKTASLKTLEEALGRLQQLRSQANKNLKAIIPELAKKEEDLNYQASITSREMEVTIAEINQELQGNRFLDIGIPLGKVKDSMVVPRVTTDYSLEDRFLIKVIKLKEQIYDEIIKYAKKITSTGTIGVETPEENFLYETILMAHSALGEIEFSLQNPGFTTISFGTIEAINAYFNIVEAIIEGKNLSPDDIDLLNKQNAQLLPQTRQSAIDLLNRVTLNNLVSTPEFPDGSRKA